MPLGRDDTASPVRAVIYARYSSDLQSDASIEDQERVCRDRIAREGWTVAGVYDDRALSGASHLRPGYQRMLDDAGKRRFDVIVAEGLDRLSRDQEHVAGLFKQLRFLGIGLFTLAEGEISELHVGLKGTMNALFLKDLAQKVHRGVEGRVRQGRSGGGLCYGYDVVRELDAKGEPVRGGRQIKETEAAVVRRIFAEFAAGASPKAIARRLNKDKIPGPLGKDWGDTTIRGHHARGTGILHNELYAGRLVWNKQRYVKDPRTGKRLARLNGVADRVVEEVPHLRIVDDALWSSVQARLQAIHDSPAAQAIRESRFWERRRARHLLTGKVFCGVCGSPAAAVGKDYLACGKARRHGTCTNKRAVRRAPLEAMILDALRQQLMAPELVEEFTAAFVKEANEQRRGQEQAAALKRRELGEVARKLDQLVDAIAGGLRGASLQAKLDDLERRKAELEREVEGADAPLPFLNPNLAEVYRDQVLRLHEALADDRTRIEATEILRGLVERVVLHPGEHGPEIELVGDIASMVALTFPERQNAAPEGAAWHRFRSSVKVVAGARLGRDRHSLIAQI